MVVIGCLSDCDLAATDWQTETKKILKWDGAADAADARRSGAATGVLGERVIHLIFRGFFRHSAPNLLGPTSARVLRGASFKGSDFRRNSTYADGQAQ